MEMVFLHQSSLWGFDVSRRVGVFPNASGKWREVGTTKTLVVQITVTGFYRSLFLHAISCMSSACIAVGWQYVCMERCAYHSSLDRVRFSLPRLPDGRMAAPVESYAAVSFTQKQDHHILRSVQLLFRWLCECHGILREFCSIPHLAGLFPLLIQRRFQYISKLSKDCPHLILVYVLFL